MSTLVIVGGGLAGFRAALSARKADFDGELVLVGAESHLPYDRPPLSKDYLADDDPSDPTFRSRDRLVDELALDLRLGAPATALDVAGRRVTAGGEDIDYDQVVLATGSTARTLPGIDTSTRGVHTLRTRDDADALRAALREGSPRVVVVGGGFIGSEIASVCRGRDLAVTLVETAETPLAGPVGTEMGRVCTALHHHHGVDVRTGAGVDDVVTEDGVLTGVRLADGTTLDADVLVLGVGAAPATAWLEGSGLTVDDGVACDATLRAADGVWVAGDLARFPNATYDGTLDDTRMRLEHWTAASEQGMRAARHAADPANAAGHSTVPYFWSDWYDSRIQLVGIASDEVEVVRGDAEPASGTPSFTALFRRADRVVGALAVDMQAEPMRYRQLIARGAGWDEAMEQARARRDGS